jgi:hypothetical protein
MLNKGIALRGMAVLAGGLMVTGMLTGGAMAQTQMASAAAAPSRDVMVFAEKGGRLSPTAQAMVSRVATDAKASHVTLVGRPESVAPVKAELQRNGVSAKAIVVKTESVMSVARTKDGLSNPADRKVEIKF